MWTTNVQIPTQPTFAHNLRMPKRKTTNSDRKKCDPLSGLPSTKAARFRLYDVVDRANTRLKNKEGVVFNAPADDVVYIGEIKDTVYVNKTELSKEIRDLEGFFWIRFYKKDGSVREMWANRLKERIAGNLSMQDMMLPNTQSRQCVIENIVDFVFRGTHYIYGRDPSLAAKKRKKKT